jgi:hypothetical protein
MQSRRPVPRLDRLLALVKSAHPGASVDAIEEGDSGFPGFRVVLPNGVDLVVGVDLDLPFALFEVVRLQVADEMVKHRFEAFSTGGFAGSAQLSADAVLEVLRSYSGLS